MLKKILSLAIIMSMISCSKSDKEEVTAEPDSTNIVGKWSLVETYFDPGDGSGSFSPVNSSKTFEFFSAGNVVSNGEICSLSTDSQNATTTTFSPSNGTIYCPNNFTMSYELSNGKLLVYFPCIEACTFKFEKVED